MSKVRIGNIACIVITLVLMVCQFMPFWAVPDSGETASISAYVGFPGEQQAVGSYLEAETGEGFNINHVVIGPVTIIALGAVGIALCLFRSANAFCALIPAAAGCVGAWGYITQTALQLGSGWGLHLALCVLLIAAAAFTVICGAKEMTKN